MTLRSLISLAASAALALLSTGLAAQINGDDCGTWVEIPGKALLPGGVAEDRPVRARRFADGSLALRSPLTVLADGGEGAYAEGDHGYVSILNNIFLLEGGQRRACYEADVFSRCASAFRAAEAAGFKSGTARFCVSGFEVEPVVEGNMLLECGDYLWVIGDGRGRLKRGEPKLNAAGQMVTSYISHTALMHRANARAKGMPLDSLSIPVAVYPESQPWPGQLVWAQHRDAAVARPRLELRRLPRRHREAPLVQRRGEAHRDQEVSGRGELPPVHQAVALVGDVEAPPREGVVEELRQHLVGAVAHHPLVTQIFRADATNAAAVSAALPEAKVDIVLTDIPYGRLAGWGVDSLALVQGNDPIHQLLESLLPVLSTPSVVAVAAAKKDKVAHGRYTRLARFQVGARQIVILQPA